MRTCLLACCAVLGACVDAVEIDLTTGPLVRLDDDGRTLTVSACLEESFLGCSPGARTLAVTVDGEVVGVPASEPTVADVFSPYSHETSLPTPADPSVGIALSGTAGIAVTLLPAFDASAPANIVRADPIVVDLEPLPDADATIAVTTRCGASIHEKVIEASARTEVHVEGTGTCTHSLAVIQERREPADGFLLTVRRIVRLSVTSDP